MTMGVSSSDRRKAIKKTKMMVVMGEAI